MRGNHEDIGMNNSTNDDSFINELKRKFLGHHESDSTYAEKFSEIRDLIDSFYWSLPVVLYMGGIEDAEKRNYLQFCHGGLEFYKPESILSSDLSRTIIYERIEKIREDAWKYYIDDEDDLKAFRMAQMNLGTNMVAGHLGYMWSDFRTTAKTSILTLRGGATADTCHPRLLF